MINQTNDKGSMMTKKTKITFHYRKSLLEIKMRMFEKIFHSKNEDALSRFSFS